MPNQNVTLQKYSVITTDFNSGEQNTPNDPKDKDPKFKFVESLKDKGKLNYHNNNRNDADSIDENCTDCRTDTNTKNTNMSTNNIMKARILILNLISFHSFQLFFIYE